MRMLFPKPMVLIAVTTPATPRNALLISDTPRLYLNQELEKVN
jgi:hypothetical protein